MGDPAGAAAHVTIAKAGRRVDGRRADGRRPPRRQFEPGRPTLISPPGPVTIPRYAPFPVRGSVHLSRQFLEKLTESAIIKVAP
jgi:hypothetical protein